MRRRRETEGVLAQLAVQACRAAVGEAFEIVVECDHALEAGEHFGEGAAAGAEIAVVAAGVDEGEAEDLAGALVDQHVDAVFGGGDLGFEEGAGVLVVRSSWRHASSSSLSTSSPR